MNLGHPASESAVGHSTWRPGWGCKLRKGSYADIIILQRVSKVAKAEEEVNAEGYINLLKEIYRCAPELCPTINGHSSKINRPGT